MTYSDKVKASKKVLDAIKALKDNEVLEVSYGIGYKGKPNVYTIRAYSSEKGTDRDMSYSIWSTFTGMNIDSMGPTTIKAYTFDMMSQKTTYMFPLYEMSIVEPIK
jgi:hypothetical protein